MTRPARGFTLVELLVGLAISAFVIMAGTGLLYSEQRFYNQSGSQRARQEAGRLVLDALAGGIRKAGYGIDPVLAFDFGDMASVPRPALRTYSRGYTQGYACGSVGPVRCRDKFDGSDEVVFYARDPLFSRPIQAVTPGSITLTGTLKEPLFAGQILQVMCLLDTQTRGYVTVGQYVPAAAVQNTATPVTVNLAAGVTRNSVPAFPNENDVLSDACFSAGAAVATKVDRFRYYVASYDESGTLVTNGTASSRPYLMLDQGLRDLDGQPTVTAVAPDVEDLQVAYLFPPAVAGGLQRVVGAASGVSAAAESFALSVTDPAPAMAAAPDAAARINGNPANIQAVRLAIVLRDPSFDATQASGEWRVLPAAGNRADQVGLAGYRRTLFTTTIIPRNMQAADVTYPVNVPAGGSPQPGLNLGGG